MDKTEVFRKELNYIKDDNIRTSAEVMVSLLPDYFFHISASSTGKYHPEYTLGDGGLVRHTKSAVRMAQELFGIYKIDDETKDLVIMALIIHDGLKKGIQEAKYTRFDHPILIGEYLKENQDKLLLNEVQIERIIKMDASHMGRWNTNAYNPDIILSLPISVEEKFVHMCDFLASRKFIRVNFDDENNILE